MKFTTSVIIVTHQRAKDIEECLVSLEEQIVKPTEVIVVENGKKDVTSEIVKKFKKIKINYIYQKEANVPKARNKGIKEARGNLILMTDDDCLFSHDWVKRIIESHKENQKAVVIQGDSRSLPADSLYSFIMQNYHNLRLRNSLGKDKQTNYLGTYNVSFKKNKLKGLKIRFDEKMKRASDSDFGAKIIAKKSSIVFDQSIFVFHKERNTLLKFLYQRFQGGRSAMYLKKRWGTAGFYSDPLKGFQAGLKMIFVLIKRQKYKKAFILPFLLVFSFLAFKIGSLTVRLKRNY